MFSSCLGTLVKGIFLWKHGAEDVFFFGGGGGTRLRNFEYRMRNLKTASLVLRYSLKYTFRVNQWLFDMILSLKHAKRDICVNCRLGSACAVRAG